MQFFGAVFVVMHVSNETYENCCVSIKFLLTGHSCFAAFDTAVRFAIAPSENIVIHYMTYVKK